jgi:hypothetical protein
MLRRSSLSSFSRSFSSSTLSTSSLSVCKTCKCYKCSKQYIFVLLHLIFLCKYYIINLFLFLIPQKCVQIHHFSTVFNSCWKFVLKLLEKCLSLFTFIPLSLHSF